MTIAWAYRRKIREGALEQAGLSQFKLQEGFNPDGQRFAAKQQKIIWQMCLPCEEVRLVIFEWAQMFKFNINQTKSKWDKNLVNRGSFELESVG